MNEQDDLRSGIAALERQRAELGDSVVDLALAPLRSKLAALLGQEREQYLKQVAILFVDIVGSTGLSSSLDPEDLHEVITGALKRFTAIVEALAGRALQYAGDSVLAVFGADKSREDDCERAVTAGLQITSEAARFAEDICSRYGHAGFNVRAGVHTGPVLLGGGLAEGSISGFAVNVAARMEQTAPTGRLRISQDAYRHVLGRFDFEPQPPLEVKGSAQPMFTYLVVGPKPRTFRTSTRGVEGLESRMVGRTAEMSELGQIFQETVDARAAACVTVVADAGLGKSRLMSEFGQWLNLRPRTVLLLNGRAEPRTTNQPYAVVRDLFLRRFEIQDSDSVSQTHDKMRTGLDPVLGNRGGEEAALIGQLIGFDYAQSPHIAGILHDGKQMRDRAFHAISRYFRLLCARDGQAIVLLLDDLHWADPGSLDFVDYLIRNCADVPLMAICAARPELYEGRKLWGSGQQNHTRMDLLPLRKGNSRELVRELLSRVEDPPSVLLELITSTAEGNPFYMEELTQMLVDKGAIVTGGDRWRVIPGNLLEVQLPGTLTGVLQARLDALPQEERAAMQPASVIGYVFWDLAVNHLISNGASVLPRLVERDLTRARETTAFDGTREFVFKHHALHQVTYESVLKRQRREQHRLCAEWLIGRSGERIYEYASLVANHFEHAGDAARASEHWLKAAENALQRFALDSALAHVERGLATAPADELSRRYALIFTRCEVYARTQSRELHEKALDELETLANALHDELKLSQCAERRAGFFITAGDHTSSLPAARRSLHLSAGRDPGLEARAHNAMSVAMARLGKYEVAQEHARAGLALAESAGDATARANLLQNMGLVLLDTGNSVEAAEFFEKAVALCRRTGDRFSECRALNGLADTRRSLGDFSAAENQMRELIRLCNEVGVRVFEGYGHLNLTLILIQLGSPDSALVHAETARAILEASGDRWAEATSRVNAGHAHFELGDLVNARSEYEAALRQFEGLEARHMALQPLAGLAAVRLREGDRVGALNNVEEILAQLARGVNLDGTDEPTRIRLTCYQALAESGDPRARSVLSLARSEILARARKITDRRIRRQFLENVSFHRQIREAWKSQSRIESGVLGIDEDTRPAA